MIRQTERPPKRFAIQRKRGIQMGMPVRTFTKKVRATVQWIRRDARRWRTISLPTATSSRSRATVTASSIARSRIGTALMVFSSSPRSRLREVGVGIRRALHLLGAEVEVVADSGNERTGDGEETQWPHDVLPELHAERHMRVAWQAVPFRMVGVREHRDDARPADALRVVERGGREAALLELIHAETPQRATMSSLEPKCRQPVGQAFTHAGSRPTDVRSTHSVHFAIFPVFAWNFGTSKGQPVSQ